MLWVGGILNAGFVLFHVWLGWRIHGLPGLAPGLRALMEMLNVGEVLLIAFATVASLGCPSDLLRTRLGTATILLIALLYGSRAAGEIVLSPGFSPAIFGACTGMATLYVLVLIYAPRAGRAAGSRTDSV